MWPRVPYASVMLDIAQIHLGDLPTWLAGLGTVGTLGAALWQIGSERKRRIEREAQEREERHQAQARLIAVVIGPEEPSDKAAILGRTGVDLINGSAEPVYRLVVAIVNIQGTSPATIESWLEILEGRDREPDVTKWPTAPITTASILPSGVHRVWIQGTGWGRVLSGRRAAEVAFTDRAGNHWIRRGTGQLANIQLPLSARIERGAGLADGVDLITEGSGIEVL
jgi:hypothetical protein